MKTFLSILALFSIAVSTSSARLGETEEECEARYGKGATSRVAADDLAESRKEFLKEGIRVSIGFWKGRAVNVHYAPAESPGFNNLSEVAITTLLAANAGGSEWVAGANAIPGINSRTSRTWTRKDGVARAFANQSDLYVVDLAFEAALEAHRKDLAAAAVEAEKARLKGF